MNLIPEYYESLTENSKLVGEFGLADAHKETCWERLCEHFRSVPFGSYDEAFLELEEQLLIELESMGAKVRNKAGKLVLNKAMKSSTYRAAKSVLKGGAKAGVTYVEDEMIMGKTAYEKKIKRMVAKDKEEEYSPPSTEACLKQTMDFITKNVESKLTGLQYDQYLGDLQRELKRVQDAFIPF